MTRSFKSDVFENTQSIESGDFILRLGEDIDLGDPLYVSSDGKSYLVDEQESSIANFSGFAAAAGNADDFIRVYEPHGRLSIFTGLNIGEELFLHDGAIKPFSEVPSSGWCRSIGVADSSTSAVLAVGAVFRKQ